MGKGSPAVTLLTTIRLSKHDPIAMLTAAMVGKLPARIDDRSLPHFNNTIAGNESNLLGRLNKFHVRPLISVVMNIVHYFAEQGTFGPQHAPSLGHKGRIGMGETIVVLLRRARA